MLLIPLTDKISWRNPPIVTILLILINCLVYFIFQFNDNEKYIQAEEYYFDSGLAEIEIAQYVKYRNPSHNDNSIYHANGKLNEDKAFQQYQDMMKDYTYLEKLLNHWPQGS